ncbi:hypothetical protein GS601_03230 [Myxacorys almedinensis A]|uniref:Secreted protein n=2 Tax=Myxacorys TaxID=2056239 RepID=A0A8J7YX94_9CYAN|nr:hypothetical protein [Myxacorys almedinensis A]
MVNKSKKIVKLLAGATIAVGLALGFVTVPTAKSEASACGFYVGRGVWSGWSFYRHCTGPVYTIVEVQLVTWRGRGRVICVKPGTIGLGPYSHIRNAYYTGRLCRR